MVVAMSRDGINLDIAWAIAKDFAKSAFCGESTPSLSDLLVGVSAWFGAPVEAVEKGSNVNDAHVGATPFTAADLAMPSYAEMVTKAAASLDAAMAVLNAESAASVVIHSGQVGYLVAVAEQWRLLAEMVGNH
jgi:hypothetical protein